MNKYVRLLTTLLLAVVLATGMLVGLRGDAKTSSPDNLQVVTEAWNFATGTTITDTTAYATMPTGVSGRIRYYPEVEIWATAVTSDANGWLTITPQWSVDNVNWVDDAAKTFTVTSSTGYVIPEVFGYYLRLKAVTTDTVVFTTTVVGKAARTQ